MDLVQSGVSWTPGPCFVLTLTEEKNKGGSKNDISFRNGPNVIIPFVDIVKLSYATHKELL